MNTSSLRLRCAVGTSKYKPSGGRSHTTTFCTPLSAPTIQVGSLVGPFRQWSLSSCFSRPGFSPFPGGGSPSSAPLPLTAPPPVPLPAARPDAAAPLLFSPPLLPTDGAAFGASLVSAPPPHPATTRASP